MSTNCVKNILDGKHDNHIFPFLWLREQTEETLRTEMAKIYDCGIRAVCLESRPHPDFGGPSWWRDFDIVLDEAHKRDMKIWILDDAHFPTGQANGLILAKYPHLARKYMMMQFVDCAGPMVAADLDVGLLMTKKFTWLDFGKHIDKPLLDQTELISVTAIRLVEDDVVAEQTIDLTHCVKDGWLTWDVPEGVWRLCVSFTTYDFGSNNEYINYIDQESVHTLIEAVYELHYDRYGSEFGKTIAGFFSDEPGFYNVAGYQMRNAIGRKYMALPWSTELAQCYENDRPLWRSQLPYLWLNAEDETVAAEHRRYYMDQVSRLYEKNFSCQLGNWCKAHGVDYVGHVIEDYEEHSRLGCGTGHYYRAMKGQAIAGIDVIGGQIIPGNPLGLRHGITDTMDARFYHFALAKMGASAAQIDPAKQGRLLCELFGAYGWNLGVKNMKWLTDFLLMQGVNHLVPHAFSMADYPDIDCPPHFYARCNNGQYPYFAELMKYANRLCDLLDRGQNVPVAAILYPAQSDWMSESMKIQEPGKELMENQLDYQVIPTDVFSDKEYYGVRYQAGQLIINERSMKFVLVPETKFIDEIMLQYILEMMEAQIPVMILNSLPTYVIGQGKRRLLTEQERGRLQVLAVDEIAAFAKAGNYAPLQLSHPVKHLLYYHYRREAEDIFCFFNTSLHQTVEVDVNVPGGSVLTVYDAVKNELYPIEQQQVDGGTRFFLSLQPYESMVLISGLADQCSGQRTQEALTGEKIDISADWTVSSVRAIDYPRFRNPEQWEGLRPYSSVHPKFSGLMRYEKKWDNDHNGRAVFAPEHIYEVAEVWVNGVSAGKKITPPYRWEIGDLLREGENTLCVEVANTPTRDAYDAPSPFGPDREVIAPSGMFGRITIER